MLGMIRKDFYIFKNQGKVLLFFVLISLGMVSVNSDYTFPITMVTMIASMFAISTIAYDEYDNGFNFLMTLPNSRKGYAISKYLFSLLAGMVSTALLTILVLGFVFITHKSIDLEEFIVTVMAGFLVSQVLVCLFIPFNLKYGSENGKFVMVLMFLVIGLGGYFILEALSRLNIEMFLMIDPIASSPVLFLLTVFIVCLAVWLVSMFISINIMKKKEF